MKGKGIVKKKIGWLNKILLIMILLAFTNGCSSMTSDGTKQNNSNGREKSSEITLSNEKETYIGQNKVDIEKRKVDTNQNRIYGYRNGDIFLRKYSENKLVKQIILVEQSRDSVSIGTLHLLVKKGLDDWEEELTCKAYLGKNGIDKTREGDLRTPSGDYGMRMAFGIKNDPGSLIPYTKLTDSMYLCGDREYYNQLIDTSQISHRCTNNSEHLIQYRPQYNYALFFDYNHDNVYGKGSAIFLHCFGNYNFTLGCISVAEENMLKILRRVDVNSRICIYQHS